MNIKEEDVQNKKCFYFSLGDYIMYVRWSKNWEGVHLQVSIINCQWVYKEGCPLGMNATR